MTVNPQLSLTESEISKIGTIKVEGIINPTNAEMDLKDGVGEDDIHVDFIYIYIKFSDFPLLILSCAHLLLCSVSRQRAGESWRPRVPGGSQGAAESTGAFRSGIRYRLSWDRIFIHGKLCQLCCLRCSLRLVF